MLCKICCDLLTGAALLLALIWMVWDMLGVVREGARRRRAARSGQWPADKS